MNISLVLLGSFESELKDKKYKIYQFIDVNSLTIINGTDLGDNLEIGKTYKCNVSIKNGKLKVTSVIQKGGIFVSPEQITEAGTQITAALNSIIDTFVDLLPIIALITGGTFAIKFISRRFSEIKRTRG